MQIQKIYNQNNYVPNFAMKFRLSEASIHTIEKTTKLSYAELTELSINESKKLMRERGTLKEPSKIKTWLADKYRKFGESIGFLEKKYNIYTDID